MNSIQAIEESPIKGGHSIVIKCEREQDLKLNDDLGSFLNFVVSDTGVGFNEENFDSFNTAFSDYKYDRGGKGLGRMMWLVAFDRVTIDSFFLEPNRESFGHRKFIFDLDYDPDMVPPPIAESGTIGTQVRLEGFKNPFRDDCPRSVDGLAHRLIEHFVLVLMQPSCPAIEIHADGQKYSVNKIFKENFQSNSVESKFVLQGYEFVLNGFKIVSPRATRHRLIYSANSREVLKESLEDHIPNLSNKLNEADGSQFVFLAIVQGKFLDQKVNNFRTDFDMAISEPNEVDDASQYRLLGFDAVSCSKHI